MGALSFLTPFGRAVEPRAADVRWFPVVGLGVGLALDGLWWGGGELGVPVLAAALVVAADLALTGMLHLDGLADTADAVLPAHLPEERRLAIMKEPSVGAFGVGAVGAALLLRFAALASMAPHLPLLAAVWVASRGWMVHVLRRPAFARRSSLGAAFAGSPAAPAIAWLSWAATAALTLVAVGGRVSLGAVEVALLCLPLLLGAGAAAGVVRVSESRLGTVTGDVIGASAVVLETVALVALAAVVANIGTGP